MSNLSAPDAAVLSALPPKVASDWWIATWEEGAAMDHAHLRPALEALLPYAPTPLAWTGPTVVPGDGVLLRPMTRDDVSALVAGADAPVGQWTSTPYPLTADAAEEMVERSLRQWEDGSAARFIVEADGQPVGTASLLHVFPDTSDAEVGYWLFPEGRGRGLASRSVRLLCEWATREVRFARLHLEVDWANAASHHTALACGFTPVGPVEWTDPRDGHVSVCLKYVR